MKITVDIPEWAEKTHIYVFAGLELIAFKEAWKDEILIKETRCNRCGLCCMNLPHPEKFPRPVVDGNCGHLVIHSDGTTSCGLSLSTVPFVCCVGDPVLRNWKDKEVCSITYRKEKLETN